MVDDRQHAQLVDALQLVLSLKQNAHFRAGTCDRSASAASMDSEVPKIVLFCLLCLFGGLLPLGRFDDFSSELVDKSSRVCMVVFDRYYLKPAKRDAPLCFSS